MTVSKERMAFDPHDPDATAAFVGRRLSPREDALVRTHAAECADCREVIAGLVRVSPDVRPAAAGEARAPLSRYLLPIAATLALGTLAAVMVLRLEGPAIRPATPAPPSMPATAPEQPGVNTPAEPLNPPRAAESPTPAARPDDLLRRRGGERTVQGKRFELTAGEWIDAAFDPLLALPVVEAASPSERQALLDKVPALRPVARLGPRVTVVHDGVVYRFQ